MIDVAGMSVFQTHQIVSAASGKRRHVSVRGIGRRYASVGIVSYGGRELARTEVHEYPCAALRAAAQLANSL